MIALKLIEILEPDFYFEDSRGTLTQITHKPYAQINAVFTKKGQDRGNYHYHRFTKEVFYVISGKIKVTLKLGDKKEEYSFSDNDMFMIPEEVRHSFSYYEDTYLVAFYTSRVELEDGTKDIICDDSN